MDIQGEENAESHSDLGEGWQQVDEIPSYTCWGHILRYIFRVELTRFVGSLKVKYEKKKGTKDDLRVFTQAINRLELQLTELGKTVGRAGWGGVNINILGTC